MLAKPFSDQFIILLLDFGPKIPKIPRVRAWTFNLRKQYKKIPFNLRKLELCYSDKALGIELYKNQVRPGIRPSHWIFQFLVLGKTMVFGENLVSTNMVFGKTWVLIETRFLVKTWFKNFWKWSRTVIKGKKKVKNNQNGQYNQNWSKTVNMIKNDQKYWSEIVKNSKKWLLQ